MKNRIWIFLLFSFLVLTTVVVIYVHTSGKTRHANCIVVDFLGDKRYVQRKIYLCSPIFNAFDRINNGHFYFFEPLEFNLDQEAFYKYLDLLLKISKRIEKSNDYRGIRIDFLDNSDTLFTHKYLGEKNVDFFIKELESHQNEMALEQADSAMLGSVKRYKKLSF